MKIPVILISCFCFCKVNAQPLQPAHNIFIITTDGFRWQEIFTGADSVIINNPAFVQDTALLKQLYWDTDASKRRRLLMPFVWKTIVQSGSVYGNRYFQNKVTLANAYRISYAGYNEILTGFADPAITRNVKKANKNQNLLEFLNSQPGYSNHVAAVASWNLFDFILNKKQSSIYQNNGYQAVSHDLLSDTDLLVNAVQQNAINHTAKTRNDMLTFVTAKEYIATHHPKVLFIGFGETDEYAHQGRYDSYLQSAHVFDQFLEQLWYLVNTDPFYKNNTSFVITTDHGRGSKAANWMKHGPFTPGSSHSWLMTIGKAFEINGESKISNEIFIDQLAQTIASIAGCPFITPHPVADPLSILAPQTNGNTGLTLR